MGRVDGRSVTPLTNENGVQTRHDVGVGVTAQQVHRCDFRGSTSVSRSTKLDEIDAITDGD